MRKKRDIIDEVLSRRTRHMHRVPRLDQTEHRLVDLDGGIYFLQRDTSIPLRHRRELYRHVPVALIAITEGYCKMLYRDLIDSGDPFLSNAKSFKDIRFDLEALVATHQRLATIGEIVAQQLSHSSLGDMESHLSVVLGQDFPAEFSKRLKAEDATIGGEVFQTQLRRLIVYTFRQRHIYCHELATRVSPRQYELRTMIKAFRVFIRLIDEHATATINNTSTPRSNGQQSHPLCQTLPARAAARIAGRRQP
ncbi:MAG TPA: hypothetical protein VIT21_11205 [Chthoniobacterales bacterium]